MASEFPLLFSNKNRTTIKTTYNFIIQNTKDCTDKENYFLSSNNWKYTDFELILLKSLLSVPQKLFPILIQNHLLLLFGIDLFDEKIIKEQKCKILHWIRFPCFCDNIYTINNYELESFGYLTQIKGFNGENTKNTEKNTTTRKFLLFNEDNFSATLMDTFYNTFSMYNCYQYNEIYNGDSNEYRINNEDNSFDVNHSAKYIIKQFYYVLFSYYYVFNSYNCSENRNHKLCYQTQCLDIIFNINEYAANIECITCCIFMYYQFYFYHQGIMSPVPPTFQLSLSDNTSTTYSKFFRLTLLMLYIILAFKKIQSCKIFCSVLYSSDLLKSKSNDKNQTQCTASQIQHQSKSSAKEMSSKLSKFYKYFEFINPNRWKVEEISVCNCFSDLQKILYFSLPIIILFNMLPVLHAECDQTFVSRVGGPQNGTFSAPLVHNPTNHSRQCLYIFLAGPGQRVEVVFTSFNLRGNPPDGSAVGELPACVHEYMDIYAEVQSSDPADLISSPFGGRYCGPIPPRRRISMYRAIALSFFTNKNTSTPDLFEGRFTFINASEYEIGIPIAGSPCSYTITPSMSINKTGALISPTYPGAYPKDMSCTYQFLGESNQRVRLEFRDFDLFFGGPHCPFDYVKVYDGPDNSSALIGTYCGQQRNLVLYSSESSLFVHFFTLPRTANTQNRGFKGIYEFSESFVKLDFIRQNDGIHIRGSECDQKILSKKESTGHVFSPNYPYPYIPKTVCRYFIYGMQDAQHLERVRLEFSIFEIPKIENKDKSESNCSDGYLKVYLKGQETADAYDKFDHELCGNETTSVVSDGPRLAMVFSSGELQGRGFKAKYTFETEYKIPGTAAPDGSCSFTYRSTSRKKGEFNSPRYPSNYPSDTNCSYLFLASPHEQVTIVFDHFKIKADNMSATGGAYGSIACFEDWLEMYVIYRDGPDRFLGRYCHLTAPGPVESPKGAVGLRILLHTDQENVASGFKARYVFEVAKSEFGDCGGNYSGQDSGIITSPGYPAQYKSPARGLASSACNWYITARIGYRVSVHFEFFSIEGEPASRGCPAAVLRLWINLESEASPIELCGEKGLLESWHYISQGQSVRISFTTTDKTIGAQGFRIVWTEIQDSGPGPPSSITLLCESTYHFQCNSGYCIADRLRCDGVKNCGPGDDSDELHCIMEVPKGDHVVLIICSTAGGLFLICLLCILCHHRRKRRHRRHLGLHRNAAHYDSTTSATGLSSSRRHLQSGSLSGSLHGINSGTLIIPPAPLPPTSVPPPSHICIAGAGPNVNASILNDNCDDEDDDDDDDDDDNETPNLYINNVHYDDDDPLNGETV